MSNQLVRGTKRICQSDACGLPFYDLNREDVSCPNCGTVLDTSVVKYPRAPLNPTPSWKRTGKSFQRAAPSPVAELAELASVEPENDGDEVVDADASELILEEDADDEVVSVVTPPTEDRNDA
jgi:hypothetical protein